MVVKEEAPVKDAKGRKTVRPKRDEEVGEDVSQHCCCCYLLVATLAALIWVLTKA